MVVESEVGMENGGAFTGICDGVGDRSEGVGRNGWEYCVRM